MKKLFIDCEWNGFGGALLSMALVSEDGDEWYEVVEFNGEIDEWVAENVIPKLDQPAKTLDEVRDSLRKFLWQFRSGIHLIADWPEDLERFLGLLVSGPGEVIATPHIVMEIVIVRIESRHPHSALWDARAIRDAVVGP
jgi:hypothetical protein